LGQLAELKSVVAEPPGTYGEPARLGVAKRWQVKTMNTAQTIPQRGLRSARRRTACAATTLIVVLSWLLYALYTYCAQSNAALASVEPSSVAIARLEGAGA